MNKKEFVVLWEHNASLPWTILNEIEARESVQECIDEYYEGDLQYALDVGELSVIQIGNKFIDHIDIKLFLNL